MNHLRGNRGLNYGDYAYIENFIQDGWSTFPLPNILRRQQHFEIWLRPVPPQNSLFALRGALYETDKLIREGIPEAGFQATKTFLLNYADLWVQDISRRLGYAMDAAVVGKDLIRELHERLPKMKKAEVDAVIKKYLGIDKLAIAIVTDKGAERAPEAGRRRCRRRSPTTPRGRRRRSWPRTRSSRSSRCRSAPPTSRSFRSIRCSRRLRRSQRRRRQRRRQRRRREKTEKKTEK